MLRLITSRPDGIAAETATGGEPSASAAVSDDELMKLTAAGARGAFRTLVARYQPRVVSICVRSAASPEEGREIAQEVFVAVWRTAPRYVPNGNFAAYLFTIVRNHLRSAARRRVVADATSAELRRGSAAAPALPLDHLLAAEDERRLRTALAALGEVHRQAILLRFTGELSYDEIATICAAPEGTVRSWVHHGLKKLRALLGEEA